MINISELYDSILEDNIDLHVYGEIELFDDEIKWSYDALGDEFDDIESHLQTIYEEDLETIQDFFAEKSILEDFNILPAETDDTQIRFSIVEE